MNFDLSEEQSILKDTLDRFLENSYGFEKRKEYLKTPDRWSREVWRQYGEMGLLTIPFSEAEGGINGGTVEAMLVMECLGKALTLEPYFPTVILGGGLLRTIGSATQRLELIPAIVSGKLILSLAHSERASRYDLNHVETRAEREGDAWYISGHKCNVLHGGSATKFFVLARTAGKTNDEKGTGLFLIDADAPGVSRRSYFTHDGLGAADIVFEEVRVSTECQFGDPENALLGLRRVAERATAALCAEAVGVMSSMQALTVDYIKLRKQFGVTIGTFQALQHKAVEMYIATEQARSITLFATMMADCEDDVARRRAISAAKCEIARQGRVVGETAVQLHGAVGMALENPIGHYFKRMTMINCTFGDLDHHLDTLIDMGGLFEPV